MTKNRAWKVLRHQVEILFFSQIKFSCDKFGLKFGRIVWNAETHLFCKFGGIHATDWQKCGLNLKIAPISVFFHLEHPRKELSTFVGISAKAMSSQTFFIKKAYFQRVWFRLCSLLNGLNSVFQPTRKTFFFRKCHHSAVTSGRDLSPNVQWCLTDPVIPSVSF